MAGNGRRWRKKQRRMRGESRDTRPALAVGGAEETLAPQARGLGPDEKMMQLRKWMKKHGFEGCYLEAAHFKETGRGLRATRHLPKNSTIIQIPRRLLITSTTALNSHLGPYIKRAKPLLTPAEALTLFLVWERSRGPASPWSIYISSLPHTYTNATYWDEDEILSFPEQVQEDARKQITKVKQVLSNLLQFSALVRLDMEGLICWESVRWAWSTINTRSVYMKQDPTPHLSHHEDDHYALAPYLDLLNHSDSAEISASFNKETEHYEIRTLTACSRFSQVFINYGPHDNMKLLTEYGFNIPDNQHNNVTFHLDDIHSLASHFQVQHRKEKFSVLIDNDIHKSMSCSLEGATWSLLTCVRILSLDYMQTKNWKTLLLSGEPLAESLERKAHQMLDHLLHEKRKKILKIENKIKDTEVKRMAAALCQEQIDIIDFCLTQLPAKSTEI